MDYFILSKRSRPPGRASCAFCPSWRAPCAQLLRTDGTTANERINICAACAAEIRRIALEGRKPEKPKP